MDKKAYQRAHRRMVRQTFSLGFTPRHRARRGYHEAPEKEWVDSHGRRGRKPMREQAMPRVQRGVLDAMLWNDIFDDGDVLPAEEPGKYTQGLISKRWVLEKGLLC